MRALVTGGAGFVGRHLCFELLEKGIDVVCVDPIVERTGGLPPLEWPLYNPMSYKNFSWVEEDCREYFERQEKFDYAFHLAAMVGGRLMIEHDPLAIAQDLAIDADFWRWARNNRPGKCVFFSSSAAYPISLQTRENAQILKEDMINFKDQLGMPDLSYGWSKLTGEYIGRLAHEKYDLSVACFRPFSGYGEDQDLTYPFPSICKRAIECTGSKELRVWGTGDQSRDFIHISDAVKFSLQAMDLIEDGSAMNLSTGRKITFKEFARIAANVVGYDPLVLGTSETPEGVFQRIGNTELQRKHGLKEEIVFEDGVKRGIEYWLDRNTTALN